MVMIDFVLAATTVDQAVSTKICELETLKATNPIVNANVLSNEAKGQKMIDYLIAQTAPIIGPVWLNEPFSGLR